MIRLLFTYPIILIVCFLLLACAVGSSTITGAPRPAISPDEVKIYLDPPSQYETIGIVESASDVEISRQAANDRATHELKSQAAKIGANGVLLINFGAGSVGTSTVIKGQGRAIFVVKE